MCHSNANKSPPVTMVTRHKLFVFHVFLFLERKISLCSQTRSCLQHLVHLRPHQVSGTPRYRGSSRVCLRGACKVPEAGVFRFKQAECCFVLVIIYSFHTIRLQKCEGVNVPTAARAVKLSHVLPKQEEKHQIFTFF